MQSCKCPGIMLSEYLSSKTNLQRLAGLLSGFGTRHLRTFLPGHWQVAEITDFIDHIAYAKISVIKFLEENIGINLSYFRFGSELLDMIAKH